MKYFISQIIIVCILLSASIFVTAANETQDILSPGLDVISASMNLTVSAQNGSVVYFSSDKFIEHSGKSSISQVTITDIPDKECGILKYGNTEVSKFQSFTADSLSSLSYHPLNNSEASFKFTYGDGYDVSCVIKYTDGINRTPTANEASEVWCASDADCGTFLYGTDPDGDKITFEITKYPEKGLVSLNKNSGKYTYSPYNNVSGTDVFYYRVCDEYGNYSGEVPVNIKIESIKNAPVFIDMDGRNGHSPAVLAVSKGFMEGYETNDGAVFNPDSNVTRENFLVSVMKSFGAENLPEADLNVFDDFSEVSDYAKQYVSAAYKLGIIKGNESDNKRYFRPTEAITKSEAAVIINNIAGFETPETIPVFIDSDSVPSWAASDLYALSANGIFPQSGNIEAGEKITREDMAVILTQLYKIFS